MIEDHLCSVQKELGEDKLSDTCFNFPRHTFEVGGVCHQALTLSCPEAARLALLAQDAFEFATVDVSVRPSTLNHWEPTDGLSLELMNEIRFFCIQIIKTQDMALWQKLALLGLFCESLTPALQAKAPGRVRDIIESSRSLINDAPLADMFNSMQANLGIQARTFGMLWLAKLPQSRPAHRKVYAAIAQGLGVDPASGGQVSEPQLVERYTQGLAGLDTVLKEAPSFFENYVLNEVFRAGFPFGLSHGHPLDQFMRLVTRFGIVRFILAVQCQPASPLPSTRDLAQTVQVFSRRFQHDEKFASQVDSCFQNSGWNQLDKIVRFLKT